MCFRAWQEGRSPWDWTGETLGQLYMISPWAVGKRGVSSNLGVGTTGPSHLDIPGYLIAPDYLTALTP